MKIMSAVVPFPERLTWRNAKNHPTRTMRSRSSRKTWNLLTGDIVRISYTKRDGGAIAKIRVLYYKERGKWVTGKDRGANIKNTKKEGHMPEESDNCRGRLGSGFMNHARLMRTVQSGRRMTIATGEGPSGISHCIKRFGERWEDMCLFLGDTLDGKEKPRYFFAIMRIDGDIYAVHIPPEGDITNFSLP